MGKNKRLRRLLFVAAITALCMNMVWAEVVEAKYYAFLDFEEIKDSSANPIPNNVIRSSDFYLQDFYPYGYTEPKNFTFPHVNMSGALAPRIVDRTGGTDKNRKALRIETGPTPAGQTKDRSEYKLKSDIKAGKDYYLSYDIYIPFNVQTSVLPTGWTMLTQVWQSPLHTPPLSISLINSGTGGPRLGIFGRNNTTATKLLLEAPISDKLNKWIKIELRFRMGPSGEVEFIVDGQSIGVAQHELNWEDVCPKASCVGTYVLKFGLYKDEMPQALYVDFDNVVLYDYEPYRGSEYGCYVSVQSCSRMGRPDFLEFSDIYIDAHSNSSTCMDRSLIWYNSCSKNDLAGAPVPRMAKTKFLGSTTSASRVTGHGCIITPSSCPKLGFSYSQSKLDTHPDAHTSSAFCTNRALEYHRNCTAGMSPSDASQVKIQIQFFQGGVLKASSVYP